MPGSAVILLIPAFTMTLSLAMLESDMTYMVADLPTEVTWNGTAYNCVVGDIGQTQDLSMGGITENAEATIVIQLSSFTSGYPDEGDLVAVGGTDYRVLGISDSPDGITRTLTVGGELQ